jgi:hypothetical protein
MGMKNRNSDNRRGRLRIVIKLAIIILVAYGAYKLVPLAWHGVQALSVWIGSWWQVRVADPIFKSLIKTLIATHGRVLTTLGAAALALWLAGWLVGSVSRVFLRNIANFQQTVQEDIIGQMENVQGKLKKLFADDIEKIALFGGSQPEKKLGNPGNFALFGCLQMLLWVAISLPIGFMMGVALYDALVRLFVMPDPDESLLASAGSNIEDLRAILPIEKSVTIAWVLTVNLSERSLALAAILCAMGFILWFVVGISNSGWTFPKPVNSAPLILYVSSAILCYFFLSSAFLIFAIFNLSYQLIYAVLVKFLFKPLYLRARVLIESRGRPNYKPDEDPARKSV